MAVIAAIAVQGILLYNRLPGQLPNPWGNRYGSGWVQKEPFIFYGPLLVCALVVGLMALLPIRIKGSNWPPPTEPPALRDAITVPFEEGVSFAVSLGGVAYSLWVGNSWQAALGERDFASPSVIAGLVGIGIVLAISGSVATMRRGNAAGIPFG